MWFQKSQKTALLVSCCICRGLEFQAVRLEMEKACSASLVLVTTRLVSLKLCSALTRLEVRFGLVIKRCRVQFQPAALSTMALDKTVNHMCLCHRELWLGTSQMEAMFCGPEWEPYVWHHKYQGHSSQTFYKSSKVYEMSNHPEWEPTSGITNTKAIHHKLSIKAQKYTRWATILTVLNIIGWGTSTMESGKTVQQQHFTWISLETQEVTI